MIDYGPLLLPYRKLDNNERLRIGLMTGRTGASWIRGLIEYLSGIRHFEVTVFTAPEPARRNTAPGWLADRLYTASKRKYNSFDTADLNPGAVARMVDGSFQAAGAAIAGSGLDLLIWLTDSLPEGSCAGLARLGVFTVQLSDGKTEPPYWREVIEGQPVSPATIYWHWTSFNRARVVHTCETSTQQNWAFTRNAEEPLAAVRRMFATIALELLWDAPAWMEGALGLPEVERPPAHERSYPSTLDALRFIHRQAARSVSIRLRGRGKPRRWFLAVRRRPELFYSNLGRFSKGAFKDIPLRGTHMADPFLVTDKGRTWLFYESVPIGTRRGRLSCMELGEAGSYGRPEVVLQRTYHLSYPCVFSHRGEYFLIPESSADRTIQLYRATRFPFEFQLEANLIGDLSAVDTTPFFHQGRWYFFTTTTEPFMETHLFWSESLDGKWQLHPLSPISSSVRNIRSAGHLFYQGGRLLRPTQDCSVRYGYGMTVNRIKRLTTSEFEEERVDFIGPTWRPGLLGTHTLNSNAAFEVIDGIRYQQ